MNVFGNILEFVVSLPPPPLSETVEKEVKKGEEQEMNLLAWGLITFESNGGVTLDKVQIDLMTEQLPDIFDAVLDHGRTFEA